MNPLEKLKDQEDQLLPHTEWQQQQQQKLQPPVISNGSIADTNDKTYTPTKNGDSVQNGNVEANGKPALSSILDRSRYLSIHELTGTASTVAPLLPSLVIGTSDRVSVQHHNQHIQPLLYQKSVVTPIINNSLINTPATTPQPVMSTPTQNGLRSIGAESLISYQEPKTKRFKTQLQAGKVASAQQPGFYRCTSSKNVLLPIDLNKINKSSINLENIHSQKDPATGTVSNKNSTLLTHEKTGLEYRITDNCVPYFVISAHSKYTHNPIMFYEDVKELGMQYGAIQVKILESDNSLKVQEQFKNDLDTFQFKTRKSVYNDPQIQINLISDFYTQLYQFHSSSCSSGAGDKAPGVFNKFPTVDKKPMDLFRLWSCVKTHGGYQEVCNKKMWLQVGKEMGYSGKIMQSLATTLRSNYLKIFQDFTFIPKDIETRQTHTINTVREEQTLKDIDILKKKELYKINKRQKTNEKVHIVAHHDNIEPAAETKEKQSTDNDIDGYFWHDGTEEYTEPYYEKDYSAPYYTIREMVLKNDIFSKFVSQHFQKSFESIKNMNEFEELFEKMISDPSFFYSVDKAHQIPTIFRERFLTDFWCLRNIKQQKENLLKYQKVDSSNLSNSKYDVSMIFSYDDWCKNDFGFPTIEYLEYGAPKVWNVIPQSELKKFYSLNNPESSDISTLTSHNTFTFNAETRYHSNFSTCSKPYFDNCKSSKFVSQQQLDDAGIKHYKIFQDQGSFIFQFDHCLTSKLSSGFSFSESAQFVTRSWFLDNDVDMNHFSSFLMNIYWSESIDQSEFAKSFIQKYLETPGLETSLKDTLPYQVQNHYYEIEFLKYLDAGSSLTLQEKNFESVERRIGDLLVSPQSHNFSEKDLEIMLFQTYKTGKRSRTWQKIDKFLREDLILLKKQVYDFLARLHPIKFNFSLFSNYRLEYKNDEKIKYSDFLEIIKKIENCPIKCSDFKILTDIYEKITECDKKLQAICRLPDDVANIKSFYNLLLESTEYGIEYPNLSIFCFFYQRLMWIQFYEDLFQKSDENKKTEYTCDLLYDLLLTGIQLSVNEKHLEHLSFILKETIKYNDKFDDLFRKRNSHSLKLDVETFESWLKDIRENQLPVDPDFVEMLEKILQSIDGSKQKYKPLYEKLDCNQDLVLKFAENVNNNIYSKEIFDKFSNNDRRMTIAQFNDFAKEEENEQLIKSMLKKDLENTEEWMKTVFQIFQSSEHLNGMILKSKLSYRIEPFENTESKATNSEIASETIVEETTAAPAEVYCYCRKCDSGSTMVACEVCEEWYHIDCVTNVQPVSQSDEPDPENNVFICSMCFSGIINLKNYDGIKFHELQKLLIDYAKLKILPNETEFIHQIFEFYCLVLEYRNRMVSQLFEQIVDEPTTLKVEKLENGDCPNEINLAQDNTNTHLTAENAPIASHSHSSSNNKFELKPDADIAHCKYYLRKAMGGHCYMLNEIKAIKRFIRKTDINEVNKLKRKKIDIVTGYPLSEQPFKDKLYFLSLDEHFE